MSCSTKKMPKALYRGKLPIGGVELDCVVLSDDRNTRLISTRTVQRAFGGNYSGLNKEQRGRVDTALKNVHPNSGLERVPNFLSSSVLIPYLTKDFFDLAHPIRYRDGGQELEGYKAEILTELCNIYITARRNNALTKQQERRAEMAETLLISFSKVGIIALIDEATGFQLNRSHDALRILLANYISEGLQKWTKRFPDPFFTELDRLYEKESTTSRTRPKYYGGFINTYIYDPIENGFVKQELNAKNISDSGKRKARFHQWLTEFGSSQLTLQIGRVMGVMETSTNMRNFKEKVSRQKQLAIQPELFNTEDFKQADSE